MKDEFGKDSIIAVCIAIIGTILLNANTLIATWRNNRAKDRETDVKESEGLRKDLTEVSNARRQNWLDCEAREKELKAENLSLTLLLRDSEKEKLPLRRRAERAEKCRNCYEETLVANNLLCIMPLPDTPIPPAP